MVLENWSPQLLSLHMGATEWVMKEGYGGWPPSWMWRWIPVAAIAEREAKAETEDEPRSKRKAREPAAVA